MGPHWIEAFRYHRWANEHLLDVCARLTDEQLELTTPGTYGSIKATWLHLAGAEQRYSARLGGGEPAFSENDGFPGIGRIRELVSASTDRLIDLAGSLEPDPNYTAKFRDGMYRVEPGVVLLQSLHHGNDHRTHICTILGAHGIEYGDMDLWAYGEAIGALAKVS
jgi:uncharacterized damage-inducible protein DinB